jgi:hypothetical protein
LPDLDTPEGLTDGIMLRISEEGPGRTGWLWKVMVPAAAAVFVILGIAIGNRITDVLLGRPDLRTAEATGLEYLDDYPPESFGEAMELAARGGGDE